VVILVFSSGKIVCTGAKKETDVSVAVHKLYDKLKEVEALYVVEEEQQYEEA